MAQGKAKPSAKKPNELTVKINVDTSEAVTEIKRLQRIAREATKDLRELEATSDFGLSTYHSGATDELKQAQDHPVHYLSGLRHYSTADLTEELSRREGVSQYAVHAHEGHANLMVNNRNEGAGGVITGPARILVVSE